MYWPFLDVAQQNRYRHGPRPRSARAREIRCAWWCSPLLAYTTRASQSLTPADWENRCASALQAACMHAQRCAHHCKVRSGGKRNRTEHARKSVVRPKRQGGDDVQCVVQKASKQAARAWAHRCVQIMLLGSIVRCWSETGMNSCPDPMVRRRQPYSSALFGWLCRPKVKINVWYSISIPSTCSHRALLCSLVP